MRSLTHGRMDRVEGSRALRARAAVVCVLASVPALMVGTACSSEPKGIEVAPGGSGGSGGDVSVGEDPALVDRCGTDGIKCGNDGCCTAGNTCSEFGRCIQDAECTTNEDCSSDSTCAANKCQPYDILPEDRRFSESCRTSVNLPSVVPTVQCSWPGDTRPAVQPDMVQVIGTPMVVDFNSDDDPETIHPSIVFISYTGPFRTNTGVIRIIDGETCELQDTIDPSALGGFPFTPQVPLALGDVNNDGRPDIVAADQEQVGAATRSGIALFEVSATGPSPKFAPMKNGRIRSASTAIITGFAIHDVDNDDYPEIFTEKTMLRFDPVQDRLIDVSALQLTGRPELTTIEPPTVMDLDGDRIAEIVTPQGVFHWNTELRAFEDKTRGGLQALWNPNPDDNEGAFMGLANLGDWPTGLPQGKDSAELVVIGHNGKVWVRQVDGQTRFVMQTIGIAGGPPVIADLDGDGRMEFASGGRDKVTVFDLDCTPTFFNARGCNNGRGAQNRDGIVWENTVQGAQSGVAVFDFDGDGRTEVVYADQCFMRVYDGRDGSVLFSTPRMSTTQWEYPVVADTDGDSYSEIVTTSNDNDTTVQCPATDPYNQNATVPFVATHGVTVWKEVQDRWAGSRPIWNQHNYFVNNVRDDGTIPPMSEVQATWTAGGPNSFRQNVQGATGRPLSLADVTTAGSADFECKPAVSQATVTVDLCNRGTVALRPGDAEIALVRSDRATQILCQKSNEELLESGQCAEIACDIPVTPSAPPFDVSILGDPAAKIRECFEGNNRAIISGVGCGPDVPR